MDRPSERLSRLYELMKAEIEILQVERKIRTRVKKQMEKTQKEYYLNEQMQAIQKELGDRDEFKNELTELEDRAKQKNLSKEAQAKVKKELKKLKMMAPMSAEAAVVRNYVDWVLGLPWGEKTQDKQDVVEAERILDEVDKMSTDFRGDPSAALLEVLDPEQNATFNDHNLDMDYDLSYVMFVCTANTMSGIPIPLLDRMEIIQLPGYTEFEKISIAQRYLIPKQIRDHGIETVTLDVAEDTLREVIHSYTKEAGVRNLEREIATICRKIAREVVAPRTQDPLSRQTLWKVTPKRLPRYLAPHRN